MRSSSTLEIAWLQRRLAWRTNSQNSERVPVDSEQKSIRSPAPSSKEPLANVDSQIHAFVGHRAGMRIPSNVGYRIEKCFKPPDGPAR